MNVLQKFTSEKHIYNEKDMATFHRTAPRQIHINTNTIMCIHRTQYVVEKFNFVKRRTHSAHFLALVFMYSCVRVWQRTATWCWWHSLSQFAVFPLFSLLETNLTYVIDCQKYTRTTKMTLNKLAWAVM